MSLPLSLILIMILAAACSTTKRLEPGEVLYTGVKKFKVNTYDNEKLEGELKSQLNKAINVPPNNPLYSPYYRTPFPIGLWVYNNWNDSAKGLKGWLYRKLVSEPVLISTVKPEVRTQMLEQILDNNGYFGSKASYELLYDKHNDRKARITYKIDVPAPTLIDSVIYMGGKDGVTQFIDSLAKKSSYLRVGSRFSVDSLAALRVNIANRLRNRGYYYFRPEYIEFMADTTISSGKVAIKMMLSSKLAPMTLYQYRVGKVTTLVERRSTNNPGIPDTIQTDRGTLIVMRPAHLRKNMIPSCITFRQGRLFSVRGMDQTQTRLSRLGIFSQIDILPTPADTSKENPVMDVLIRCRYDRPMTASVEVNATSKSNSYIGPGLVLGLTHNNIFGGAERLSFKLNADYEWQTGHNRSSVFNSYEFGLSTSLAFPRLLAPSFIRRIKREINWTTINLSGDVLNRPHYFKMSKVNAGVTYEWHPNRWAVNQFSPFKLTFTKLMKTTHDFDSIMGSNPAIAQSFRSQFIPQMSYMYTLDRYIGHSKNNRINFQAIVTEAGNIFDGLWRMCGHKGEKKLFGLPFSQFVKGQVQLVYGRRLVRGSDQWLVSRLLIGAAHAYGNSDEVPYSEQFYIGGANSIRAFTVRSLGPGSYRSPEKDEDGFFDQTGTFKFEINSEYRFPIIGILHGAAFVDAGNIWLLKKDSYRPGGQLKLNTFFKDIALGTGVGLRLDLDMIVVRGDLGYGLHAPYATDLSGYFNIKPKDAFAFHLAIGYPF